MAKIIYNLSIKKERGIKKTYSHRSNTALDVLTERMSGTLALGFDVRFHKSQVVGVTRIRCQWSVSNLRNNVPEKDFS